MTSFFAGEWQSVPFCEACDKPLTWRQVMNNRGVCPFCGARSGDTIVKVKQKSMRGVYRRVCWFFSRRVRIEVIE